MADTYESLDEKPYGSSYLHADTIINHPVERAWPHVLNIGSWMTDHRLETLVGEPGQVGHFERVFSRDFGEGVPLPHYHLYGIAEIIPFKFISLEVFREKGGSYGDTKEGMAFDSILLTDLGGKTKLTFLQIEVQLGERERRGEDSQERSKHDNELALDRLNRYFENLKQLVHASQQHLRRAESI